MNTESTQPATRASVRLSNEFLAFMRNRIKEHYVTQEQGLGWATKARELWLQYQTSHYVDYPSARYAYIKGAGKSVSFNGALPVVFASGEIYRLTPGTPRDDPYGPCSVWLDHPDETRWTTYFHLSDVVLIDFEYK